VTGPPPFCTILPPHILRAIAERGSPRQRARALASIEVSERIRGRRQVVGRMAPSAEACALERQRTVFDARHKYAPPYRRVRQEKGKRSRDRAVNEAFDGAGATFDLFLEAYGRCSIDGRGLPMVSVVHYGADYDNAFWDGQQMYYGDGDGLLFNRFTVAVDIIGHELTHGVTQYEAALEYQGQPGALNEHFSDVFGSLVKQRLRGQKAGEADWIIGGGLFTDEVDGDGLRSMAHPGEAYDDDLLGKDPQPAHMRDFVVTEIDNGGVHINSGIPNRAFHLAATAVGGKAWEGVGRVWYDVLANGLGPRASFAVCASRTIDSARRLFGARSKEAKGVASAWRRVGVSPP
jgi:Zn-dependent metalloprotease